MVNGYEAKVRGRELGLWGRGMVWPAVGGGFPPLSFTLLGQVYGASNVELITRTRTEHLSDQHKGKSKGAAGANWVGRVLCWPWPSPPPFYRQQDPPAILPGHR